MKYLKGIGIMNSKLKKEMKPYLYVLLLTAVVFLLYFILNQFRIKEIWVYDADKAVDDFIRRILEGETASGIKLFDFCQYNIQNLMIFVLCRIFGNVSLGINLYFTATFFFISIASYWCMKTIGVRKKVSIFIAVLLSFVPFHIDRGEGQIITSTFFLVPVFLGIMYQMLFLNNRIGIKKGEIAFMAVIPFIDWRLAVMFLILMTVLMVHRGGREIYQTAGVYIAILSVMTLFVGILSGVFGTADIVENIRLAREEGLRLLDMVLPLRYHVSDRLWNIRYEYDISFSVHGECGLNSQGMLISIGFLYGILALFFGRKTDKRIQWLAWISVIVILVSVVGGFNLIFEYFGINLVYWNRMGIIIIVCSAAILGILMDKMVSRLSQRVPLSAVYIVTGLAAAAGMAELVLRQNM